MLDATKGYVAHYDRLWSFTTDTIAKVCLQGGWEIENYNCSNKTSNHKISVELFNSTTCSFLAAVETNYSVTWS